MMRIIKFFIRTFRGYYVVDSNYKYPGNNWYNSKFGKRSN
jgi:hypothetical protein